MVLKYIGAAVLAWILSYLYSCTPERWTSFERLYKETLNRAVLPLTVFDPLLNIDGKIFDLDTKKLLPMEAHVPYIEMPKDTPLELALSTLKTAWERQDAIIVWKGFTSGTAMDKYKSEEYCRKVFKNDNYEFLVNGSNFAYESTSIKNAIDNMEDRYLGFSYSLLKNNKDTLLSDFVNTLKGWGSAVNDIVPVDRSLHHAFLYKGKKYHTGLHQAPISDWFFQISNSKTWRFVHPKYTPYIKPVTWDGVSMLSAFDYLPDDCGIPYVDVTTDEGDMMFFPAHWWHEVHNNGDNWGLAFGFRPKADVGKALFDIVLPLLANKGLVAHRLLFFMGSFRAFFIRNFSGVKATTLNDNSGLKSRIDGMVMVRNAMREFIPTWSWDNFPERSWGPKPMGDSSCAAPVAV